MESRGHSGRSDFESHDQLGLDFCSVLVSNIPDSVSQRDLKSHFYRETKWSDEPDVKMMSTQAIVAFRSPSYAMDIARKAHTTFNGTNLTLEPYIKVFSAVTAVIPAKLCDHLPNDVIGRLQNKTGVHIKCISRNNTLEITGSLHEIEQAQKLLSQRFATIVNEQLQAASQPSSGMSPEWSSKYNHNSYMDTLGATGYGQVDKDENFVKRKQEAYFVEDSDDSEIGHSFQTNGVATNSLDKILSKDGSGNSRSRSTTRQMKQRSSSLSRIEMSTRTKGVESRWGTTEGPAEIIDRKLDRTPHTKPILSSNSSNGSKYKSATAGLKLKATHALPSKPMIRSTMGKGSVSTSSTVTGASSSKTRSGLRGASGGVGVSATTKASRRKVHAIHTYKGVKVSIVLGDLTEEVVDVIVSSVGGDLKNLGGVARAISRAGGPSIQRDCDRYRKTHGALNTTECMATGPGRLPCNHVVHAVGPVYQSRNPFKTEQELRNTTVTALTSAALDLQAQSIALPAISSGTFHVPKDMCAKAMLAGIKDFAKTQRQISSSLQDIRIVDNDFGTVLAFTSQCQKLFDGSVGNGQSQRGSRRRSSSMSRAESRSRTSSFGLSSDDTSNIGAASGATVYGSFRDDIDQTLTGFHDKTDYIRDEKDWNYQDTSEIDLSQAPSSDRYPTTMGDDQEDDTCPICMCEFTDPKTLPCKHKFCAECLANALKHAAKCPICGLVLGKLRGDQPDGRMECEFDKYSLPGYPTCGTITIHYNIPSGIQGKEHPNPGCRYHGTSRTAYLPDNLEGREVLDLLKDAWRNKLIFTIGTSVTTGTSDVVTWNDIHHKTNRNGGPTRYGYPDPAYLGRVKEELAAKGIKPRPSTV